MPRNTVLQALEPNHGIGKLNDEMSQDLETLVDEGTDGMGVMLYYGDLEKSVGDNGPKYDLLNHCIACLQTVHHKGNAIIKLTDSFNLFNASLIFLLYQLFEQVTVTKPYAGDFTTFDQFLTCTGLRIRKPQPIIEKLKSIK